MSLMALAPAVSLPMGAATAALVYAVYTQATPPIADIRSAPAQDNHIDASRKQATWVSVGIVSAVSLLAKDPTIFVLGGAMVIIMDFWTRHANAVSPQTGGMPNAPSMNDSAPTGTVPMTTDDVAYDVGVYA